MTQKSKKRDNFDQQIAEEVEVGANALAFLCLVESAEMAEFLFADAHGLCLADIAESAEMAAFGLALLRSF